MVHPPEEPPVSRRIRARSRNPRRRGVVTQEDVLGHAQVAHQVQLLVDRRHPPPESGRRASGRNRFAVHADLACRRLDRAGDALDQRRFPRSVGPDEAVNLTGQDIQVDAAKGDHARVLLHQTGDLEDG